MCRQPPGMGEHRLRAVDEARAEHRVGKIGLSLLNRGQRKALRHDGQAEAGKLREDVPDPVRLLATLAQLLHHAVMDRRLCIDKSGQIDIGPFAHHGSPGGLIKDPPER